MTQLFNVTGLVNPAVIPEKDYDLSVVDRAGDKREVHLCFENVPQDCWVYVQAQVRATCEIQAQDMVTAVVLPLLNSSASDTDHDIGANEADEDEDHGC